jgi:hypothetical protein
MDGSEGGTSGVALWKNEFVREWYLGGFFFRIPLGFGLWVGSLWLDFDRSVLKFFKGGRGKGVTLCSNF